jgi:hypothetical protein
MTSPLSRSAFSYNGCIAGRFYRKQQSKKENFTEGNEGKPSRILIWETLCFLLFTRFSFRIPEIFTEGNEGNKDPNSDLEKPSLSSFPSVKISFVIPGSGFVSFCLFSISHNFAAKSPPSGDRDFLGKAAGTRQPAPKNL